MNLSDHLGISRFLQAETAKEIEQRVLRDRPRLTMEERLNLFKDIAIALYDADRGALADRLISDVVDFSDCNTGASFELEKLKFLNQPITASLASVHSQAADMARRGVYDVIIANRFDQLYRPLVDDKDPVAFHRELYKGITGQSDHAEFTPKSTVRISASAPNDMTIPNQMLGTHFLIPKKFNPKIRRDMYLYHFREVDFLKYGAGLAVFRQNEIFPGGMNMTGMLALPYTDTSSLERFDLGGPVIMPMDAYSCSNYGHWLLDYLYRIIYLIDHFELNPKEVTILVRDRTRFYEQTLEVLGIGADQIVPVGRRALVSADDFYACSTSFTDMHTHTQQMDPAIIDLLRKRLGGEEMRSVNAYRKLYISRGDVGERNIEQEDKLIEEVERIGFEAIRPGDLSFKDQIRIFSEAKMIMGPHSSGLCNLLFAPRDCEVIEIMPPYFGTGVNADLSCTLGMKYSFWAEGAGREFEDFRYLTSYFARDDFAVDRKALFNRISTNESV